MKATSKMNEKEGGRFLQRKREEAGLSRVGMSMVASWSPDGPKTELRIDEQTLARIEDGRTTDPKFTDVVVYCEILKLSYEEVAKAYGYSLHPQALVTKLIQ
ncbi:MAG: helix-turn-helix domain-containing protein [Ktedonobacteraceae bacterium]